MGAPPARQGLQIWLPAMTNGRWPNNRWSLTILIPQSSVNAQDDPGVIWIHRGHRRRAETLEEFEARVQKKRQELIAVVGEAFDKRQELHLQEIARMIKQAQEAQATVVTRSMKRKQIVEKRVVDLLKLPSSE